MAKKQEIAKDRVSLTLRLDGDVHEALKRIAALEMRSLNTQIEYYLRQAVLAYESPRNFDKDSLYSIIQRISNAAEAPASGVDPEP